ncbi:MAG: excinuclease ABC subunit UvrC [Bacillota bacterium]|nr:excinuclease ABC subunit UvrC [Bacillota bacterium]
MEELLSQKLKNLPDKPGVYIMKDAGGEVIYVGKALSIKNRVRQYFHSPARQDVKVCALAQKVSDIEYIITDSELEALALECNLIKKHLPRYNILLKDDKNFPYVKINVKTPYPRVEWVRKLEDDGAKYFGPYLAVSKKMLMDEIAINFPLRSCTKDIEKARKRGDRPCLNYHIGRCLAPCAGNISLGEYAELVKQACAFLGGKYEEVLSSLKEEMNGASKSMEFEKAARLRDRIAAIERMVQRQKAITAGRHDRDALGMARKGDNAVIQAFFVRQGKIIGSQKYFFEEVGGEKDEDIWEPFLQQVYSFVLQAPPEVLLPVPIPSQPLLEAYLSRKAGRRVHILCPVKGEKKKLVMLAETNAIEAMEKESRYSHNEWERNEGAQIALCEALGIAAPVHRIEAFDISNIQGTDSVASMTVFVDGRAQKKEYRRFKIKTVEGADDFASMHEVVLRRFRRWKQESGQGLTAGFGVLPDLVLIDGGKGQLNAALAAMREAGVSIPAAGLAKRMEEIYLPGQEEPVRLPLRSPALHLLERARDEAHRFAISYHRSLRGKGSLQSELEGISGVGPKKRIALMQHFASKDEIASASVEQLRAAPGMDIRSARAVYAHYHGQSDADTV